MAMADHPDSAVSLSPAETTDAMAAPRVIDPDAAPECPVAFTFATLVTDAAAYEAMRESLTKAGFTGTDIELLMLDNTHANRWCAYRGLNRALAEARGRYVVLCHQDVRFDRDGRAALEARLDELNAHDPNWAIASNAGGVAPGRLAVRITDPHGSDQGDGPFPQRVETVDENFIVVRREARVGFSRELTGYHLYGADLCLNAAVAGHTAYVIDYHLTHLSGGNKDASFAAAAGALAQKWSRAFRPRWLQTTCTLLHISAPGPSATLKAQATPLVRAVTRRLNQRSQTHGT